MIIVGQASVNPDTGNVELVAPLGFATARAVRVSNFNSDAVILSNISGVDQSQEYLMPQQQNVYPTANAGRVPTANGLSLPPDQIATNLLVEWSTDPQADFLGTYPVGIPAQVTSTNGTARTTTFNHTTGSAVVGHATPLGTIPGELGLLTYRIEGTGVPYAYIVAVFELDPTGASIGCVAGQVVIGADDGLVFGQIPFRPTHDGILNLIVSQPDGTTPNNVSASMYTLNNSDLGDLPLAYIDLMQPLQYTGTATPVAGGNIGLAGPVPIGSALQPVGELLGTLQIITSGHGKATPGWVDFGDVPPAPYLNYPLISSGDCHVIDGVASDILIGYRPVDIPGSAFGEPANENLVYETPSTTDTGDITVTLTLAQRRAPYSISQNS